MRIHLVGTGDPISAIPLLSEKYPNSLFSFGYAEQQGFKHYSNYWHQLSLSDNKPNLIFDSGAFTAFKSGKIITVEEYFEFISLFKERWQGKFNSFVYMNLDVIGDQEKSEINQKKLEKKGLNPMPIFTYGADIKIFKEMVANYPYIALGGLVGRKNIIGWLDYCFCAFKRESIPKIHLLGITKEEILLRYPAYTCDSSSWTSGLRFGRDTSNSFQSIPRLTDGGRESVNAIKIHSLRKSIQQFNNLSHKVTNYWTKKGVIWSD